MLTVTSFTVGAFQENSHLLADAASGDCVMIDPGAEGDRLVAAVEESGAALREIWITHAHVDHVGGIAALRRRWDVPVRLHPADDPLWRVVDRQAAAYGLPFECPPADYEALAEGDELRLGAARFTVMHTPGHAPGHCVFHGEGIVLAGDLLFAGSIGRTDLPFSDPVRMQASLARIASLEADVAVHAGHGPPTTIGTERRTNPFLTGAARPVMGR